MPLLVELVLLEQTQIAVSLMFSFAIVAFENVWAWFAFSCFKSWQVGLEICLAIPC